MLVVFFLRALAHLLMSILQLALCGGGGACGCIFMLWWWFYICGGSGCTWEVLLLLHNQGSISIFEGRSPQYCILCFALILAALYAVQGYDFCPLRDLESQKVSPTIL